MEVIKRGAEAVLYKDGDRVIKERIPKGYRHPELDRRLRQSRTKREARLLSKAREIGVPTPRVLSVEDHRLIMEYIDGPTLKHLLYREKRKDLMRLLGELVGRLHSHDIVHGDLTTSNVIVADRLYLIDFGLGEVSKRIEDKAVDIVCFEKSYFATHPDFPEGWSAFLEGYRTACPCWEEVLKRAEDVKRRARYL